MNESEAFISCLTESRIADQDTGSPCQEYAANLKASNFGVRPASQPALIPLRIQKLGTD
jgi:hypothetical protein